MGIAPAQLIGRERERRVLRRFLTGERDGAALVLEGDAGIGKTTLWWAALEKAAPFGILRCTPAQGPRFAALEDLVRPALDELTPSLLAGQREALEVAWR